MIGRHARDELCIRTPPLQFFKCFFERRVERIDLGACGGSCGGR
jgi:hypothetical protein